MAAIPRPVSKTVAAIVAAYEAAQDDGLRAHLGASIIGRECSRQIWYSFRWAKKAKHSGQLLRLFETGHLSEPRFVANLRAIGAEVYECDESGKQWRIKTHGGHFAGSTDGVGRGLPEAPKSWAVLEFKTHNDKSFRSLVSVGVQEHKPEHYVQMQVYMHHLKIERALYLAVNKNTDELHAEWIHYNKEVAERANEKALRIITSPEPPAGISVDPAFFKCKYCDYDDICHGGKVPEPTCRSCAQATPVLTGDDGTWTCSKWNCEIPVDGQKQGCSGHRYIPILLASSARAIDYHKGDVIYESKTDGKPFANGEGPAAFSSQEIHTVGSITLLGEAAEIKGMYPMAKVVG